jgi:hypothetical protein
MIRGTSAAEPPAPVIATFKAVTGRAARIPARITAPGPILVLPDIIHRTEVRILARILPLVQIEPLIQAGIPGCRFRVGDLWRSVTDVLVRVGNVRVGNVRVGNVPVGNVHYMHVRARVLAACVIPEFP